MPNLKNILKKLIENTELPDNEMNRFVKLMTQLTDLVPDEETYDKIASDFEDLDYPLENFIGDAMSGEVKHVSSSDVMAALEDGYKRFGTEPRAAVSLATELIDRAIRKLKSLAKEGKS